MSQPEIVVIAKLPDLHMAHLEKNFTCHKLYEAEDREAFLAQHRDTARGVVTNGLRGFKADIIEALPNLEIISVWGAGLQALDLEAARRHGIFVTNTPDNSKIAVAELGIALMLNVGRRIMEADKFVKSGAWASGSFTGYGSGFYEKKLGIVALGTIGRAVAERAASFGMKISYFGPNEKSDVPYTYTYNIVDLARNSDFLMLCCPETPETTGLITSGVLEALGPEGVLINISRGVVVDENALIDALKSGVIKGAGLDVFVDEPNVPDDLRNLENVVLMPHIGTATADVRRIRMEMTVTNLQDYFNGKPLSSALVEGKSS
ncbi:MAG: 2-hydroxyacid dehydrogenase [Methyloligellaceae bacterium]